MIFSGEVEMLEVKETGDHMQFLHGQDILPTLQLNHWLRENDETKGWSKERQFKHLATIPEIAYLFLIQERPEALREAKEFKKWLDSDMGREFKTSKDAAPLKGDSLQVIIR